MIESYKESFEKYQKIKEDYESFIFGKSYEDLLKDVKLINTLGDKVFKLRVLLSRSVMIEYPSILAIYNFEEASKVAENTKDFYDQTGEKLKSLVNELSKTMKLDLEEEELMRWEKFFSKKTLDIYKEIGDAYVKILDETFNKWKNLLNII